MKSSPVLSNALIAVATLGSILFAPVAAAADSQDRDTPMLVRLKPDPKAVWLTARLNGALQVRDGCVYFISRESKEWSLTIWPSSYQLLESNGKAEGVTDSLTGHSVKLGVQTSFGGGEAKHVPAAMLETNIPSACIGKRSFIYFSNE